MRRGGCCRCRRPWRRPCQLRRCWHRCPHRPVRRPSPRWQSRRKCQRNRSRCRRLRRGHCPTQRRPARSSCQHRLSRLSAQLPPQRLRQRRSCPRSCQCQLVRRPCKRRQLRNLGCRPPQRRVDPSARAWRIAPWLRRSHHRRRRPRSPCYECRYRRATRLHMSPLRCRHAQFSSRGVHRSLFFTRIAKSGCRKRRPRRRSDWETRRPCRQRPPPLGLRRPRRRSRGQALARWPRLGRNSRAMGSRRRRRPRLLPALDEAGARRHVY